VEGVVTLEDLVETLLGLEIVDEADKTVDMRALARSRWKQRARRLGIQEDLEPQ
jgi:CBS domain containing-hemolysin-like protein